MTLLFCARSGKHGKIRNLELLVGMKKVALSYEIRQVSWAYFVGPKEQDTIILPLHPNCKIGENDIIATFHTHPNTGSNYLQEPGETDKRAVRDDPDLKGSAYVGEFVISQATIYLVAPSGQVREMGNTREVLGER
jgi:hypothetical protein